MRCAVEAGRELDVEVAVQVMGWKREGKGWIVSPLHTRHTVSIDGSPPFELESYTWDGKGEHDVLYSPDNACEKAEIWLCGCHADKGELPPYSTDIAAAWLVIGEMQKLRGDTQRMSDFGYALDRVLTLETFMNYETSYADMARDVLSL